MKKLIFIILLGCNIAAMQSCKDEINNYYNPDSRPEGTIVTTNPTEILSFSDVAQLKSGTKLKLRLNRSGNEVREYEVTLDGVYDFEGERLIFCTTPANLPIGSGDSGSPLLTTDGKVIGALCYGWEFSKNQFAARAIDDMLTIKEKSLKSVSQHGETKSDMVPIKCVEFITGIDKACKERYSKFMGENNILNGSTIFVNNKEEVIDRVKSSNSFSALPGMSVAILKVYGKYINMGAIGTLSFIKDNKMYAFGHSFYSNKFKMRATEANMVSFIKADDFSFKIALPTSNTIGAFTTDSYSGIVINKDSTADEYMHKVNFVLTPELVEKFGTTEQVVHYINNSENKYEESDYAAFVTGACVYYRFLKTETYPLKAECKYAVTYLNDSVSNGEFTEQSDSYIDSRIFYALYDKLNYNQNSVFNIKDFSITINLSTYTPDDYLLDTY